MAIITASIPQRYLRRLDKAHARLDLFSRDAKHGRSEPPQELLYPHTVWYLHAGKLLEGRTLRQSMRRCAWAYYFMHGKATACAVLEIARGRRESISFSEGPFVAQVVRLIRRADRDERLQGKMTELRVMLAPALHFGCVWLRAGASEYFVAASKGTGQLKFGRWLSRAELEAHLLKAAERVRTSQAHMRELVRLRQEHAPRVEI